MQVPIAPPDPRSVFPLSPGCPAAPLSIPSVPRRGPCAFGARRAGGRRTIGVTLPWPDDARLIAPLPGRCLGTRPWQYRYSDGTPLRILFFQTERYLFGFGGIVTWWGRQPVEAGTPLVPSKKSNSLHVSMFELPRGFSGGDLLGTLPTLVWKGRPPEQLRDPTEFLDDALRGPRRG